MTSEVIESRAAPAPDWARGKEVVMNGERFLGRVLSRTAWCPAVRPRAADRARPIATLIGVGSPAVVAGGGLSLLGMRRCSSPALAGSGRAAHGRARRGPQRRVAGGDGGRHPGRRAHREGNWALILVGDVVLVFALPRRRRLAQDGGAGRRRRRRG
jgi:hypothetical protein